RRRWTGIPVTSSRVFVGSNPTLSARKDAKALSRKRAFFIFAVALAHVRLHSSYADVPQPAPSPAPLRYAGKGTHAIASPPRRRARFSIRLRPSRDFKLIALRGARSIFRLSSTPERRISRRADRMSFWPAWGAQARAGRTRTDT